ncbi:protein-(glutamine-N5) methyltransferase, release factor-specific [Niabella ginsenosidivorans]|uniref:peptide chain release factor N(5)-glutamine methyltransferase n=1 Tax=Niabella ginsenosidivorans TaxID=1176587 RepID=A0A1A9I0S2_9BACT|nr:peptide chain release factor N(5)-glutamine methyltransferase [Niabella ginsenosidivorans]ANH81248.1 protein-(glutamine-N5) methyltransferase, release factor-specific [Niabella ginsenosidivorans]
MNLQELQEEFISAISAVYETTEAWNIWNLIVHHIHDNEKKGITIAGGSPQKYLEAIKRRLLQQEPVQYILQEAWFYDCPFYVDKNVLIPRPETEELVHWVIKEHQHRKELKILDIGTGSGCIPCILKRKLPQAAVFSCDISKAAIEVARRNAAACQLAIAFFELDFLNPENWKLLPKVDVIVSNPPYIPGKDRGFMHPNVLDYEPSLALFVPDNDPLLFYKKIAEASGSLLQPNGAVYVETHEELAVASAEVFEQGAFTTVIRQDLQGKNRFVKASN